ncbi:MAG: mechanosensitive ion channel, partial [Desulfurococcaceae archaeon]
AVRSLVRILGLGALLAGIAGGVAGGAAGVALGGFIGLVVGFATQQVLGQAVAGMFILLARPFKINDIIDVAGESEIRVKDITTLFTIAVRKDGLEVLIPSSMIIGQKIIVRERSKEK